jgi:hypothetical protein
MQYRLGIRHQAWRRRTDEHASGEVAKHRPEAESPKQGHSNDACRHQDNRGAYRLAQARFGHQHTFPISIARSELSTTDTASFLESLVRKRIASLRWARLAPVMSNCVANSGTVVTGSYPIRDRSRMRDTAPYLPTLADRNSEQQNSVSGNV